MKNSKLTFDELANIAITWSKRECVECPIRPECGDGGIECNAAFLAAYAAGLIDLDGKRIDALAESEEHSTALPSWCKENQWVFYGEGCLAKITAVNAKENTCFLTCPNNINTFSAAPIPCLQPVRFREYTYEEAKKLLGKTIERNLEGKSKHFNLVCLIDLDTDGRLFINAGRIDSLMKRDYTIDGVPIGVPVVDEEAMKEGEL